MSIDTRCRPRLSIMDLTCFWEGTVVIFLIKAFTGCSLEYQGWWQSSKISPVSTNSTNCLLNQSFCWVKSSFSNYERIKYDEIPGNTNRWTHQTLPKLERFFIFYHISLFWIK
jgi:hypothetical protein